MKNIEIAKVTLLSVEEAKKVPEEIRKAECSWWLRSPGNYVKLAAFVLGDGVSISGHIVEKVFGVRPALKLNPDSSIKRGDSFSYRGYEWDAIADGMALCRSIVGKCPFRRDYEADDANDYESSDIKQWLDDWWKSL